MKKIILVAALVLGLTVSGCTTLGNSFVAPNTKLIISDNQLLNLRKVDLKNHKIIQSLKNPIFWRDLFLVNLIIWIGVIIGRKIEDSPYYREYYLKETTYYQFLVDFNPSNKMHCSWALKITQEIQNYLTNPKTNFESLEKIKLHLNDSILSASTRSKVIAYLNKLDVLAKENHEN